MNKLRVDKKISHQRILIIDDDEDFSKELSERLAAEEYIMEVINDSFTVNSRLLKTNYDLILLDYKMPGLNGIELLKLVKKTKPLTKVIIISGRPFLEKLLEAEAATAMADAIISKPFNDEELLHKIKTVLAPQVD